eukprot:6862558-Heterocapsa_arctica.AAC.1
MGPAVPAWPSFPGKGLWRNAAKGSSHRLPSALSRLRRVAPCSPDKRSPACSPGMSSQRMLRKEGCFPQGA